MSVKPLDVFVANYTPYFAIETAAGRAGLMSCLRCGALVLTGDDGFHAPAAHDSWHAHQEKKR